MNILDDATLIRRQLEHQLSPEHVDQHLPNGELAIAAGFYALHSAHAVDQVSQPVALGGWALLPKNWPTALHPTFWRPSTDRRRLAAYSVAFLAMEADRLERARSRPAGRRA